MRAVSLTQQGLSAVFTDGIMVIKETHLAAILTCYAYKFREATPLGSYIMFDPHSDPPRP